MKFALIPFVAIVGLLAGMDTAAFIGMPSGLGWGLGILFAAGALYSGHRMCAEIRLLLGIDQGD